MTRVRLFYAGLVVAMTCVAAACGSDGQGDAAPDASSDASFDAALDAASDPSGDGASADGQAAFDSAFADATALDAVAADVAAVFDAANDGSADATADVHADASDAGADAHLDGGSDSAGLDASADAPALDSSGSSDAGDGSGGVITGGPCLSGAAGATAFRIRFVDAGGQAVVQYEVSGLPDKSHDTAGAYGYQIGYTPAFVDPFLGAGGLQLDDSDFVDLELSTAGVPSIARATLAIYGRSYSVDTSGSFNWQTLVDTGATSTDFVSNVAPYRWYAGDATSAIDANDSNMRVRIKAGPSSDALVVNRIELCIETN